MVELLKQQTSGICLLKGLRIDGTRIETIKYHKSFPVLYQSKTINLGISIKLDTF